MEQISFKEWCEKYVHIKDGQNNYMPFHSEFMDKLMKLHNKIDEGYELRLIHKRRGGTEIVAYKKK